MSRQRATAIGFTAVMLWALLALLTIRSAPVPAFQLCALTFGIGGGLGVIWTSFNSGLGALLKVPLSAYLFGTAGLFGYHFLYFTAFRVAPTAETGLIAYLWPLLIVLLSGLLPGERLGPHHVIGAVIAFAGAGLLVTGGSLGDGVNWLGAGLALMCAFTWAIYSVGSRRFAHVPTEAVTVTCLATALLSLLAHLGLEQTSWPESGTGWAAVLLLGLGPVGAAFFAWDIGMKRGNIQLLGVASYGAPLLSTLILVATKTTPASPMLAVAAVLVAGGAALASRRGTARPS